MNDVGIRHCPVLENSIQTLFLMDEKYGRERGEERTITKPFPLKSFILPIKPPGTFPPSQSRTWRHLLSPSLHHNRFSLRQRAEQCTPGVWSMDSYWLGSLCLDWECQAWECVDDLLRMEGSQSAGWQTPPPLLPSWGTIGNNAELKKSTIVSRFPQLTQTHTHTHTHT